MSRLAAWLKARRFFVGAAASDKPVTLTHRRIFILPNQRGIGFCALILLLLLIAFVYANNLVYLLAFLLSGVLVVTMLHSFKSLAGLMLQKGQSTPVFAGEDAVFNLHISNPGNFGRAAIDIVLEQPLTVTLPSQSKITVRLYAKTRNRGWHRPGKVTVSSLYPLGLFRAWAPVQFDFKVLVYPKPAEQSLPFPDAAAVNGEPGGGGRGGEDFYGVREYQPGDAIKHIHWKALAKRQGVFSKQYGSERADELWLDYAQIQGNGVEERLSRLCRWVINAEQAGLRYGLRLPELVLAPSSGSEHYRKCLTALALF